MRLENKVSIVTGAGAGIGRAAALLFAKEGARVAAVDLKKESLDELTDEIRKLGGEVLAVAGDVSEFLAVRKIAAEVLHHFGRIDILFNNAGIVHPGKLHETSEAQWDETMTVNVKSMFLFSKQVIPVFREQGGGVILNTASAAVLRTVPDRAAYAASKGAVVSLTRSMALDYVKDKIRVNCLCPGTIDTPSLKERLKALGDVETARRQFEARQPMGRFGTAEEIAQAALYLVSEESGFVTGAAFSIDGGFAL